MFERVDQIKDAACQVDEKQYCSKLPTEILQDGGLPGGSIDQLAKE